MNVVDFLVWDSSFSVGNETLDKHHERLFQMISAFNLAAESNESRGIMLKLMSDLKDYTSMHFMAEEAFMASQGYQSLEDHKVFHRELLERIADYEAKLKGQDKVASLDISKFLREWIVIHVLNEDMDYSIKK